MLYEEKDKYSYMSEFKGVLTRISHLIKLLAKVVKPLQTVM